MKMNLRTAAAAAVAAIGVCWAASAAQALTTTVNPNQAISDNSTVSIPITVTDSGLLTSLSITVAASHTWIGDLRFQLQNPSGLLTLTLMNRPVGSGESSDLLSSFPITFIDGAPNDAETMGNTIGATAVVCRDDGRCSYFANPDGDASSTLINFAGFNASEVNGIWHLLVQDSATADTGTVASITLTYDLATNGVSEVPLPAALPLFASGLGALGFTGWRKRRKNAAAA